MIKGLTALVLAITMGFAAVGFSEPLVKKVIQLQDGTRVTGHFTAKEAKKLEKKPKGTYNPYNPYTQIPAY